MNLDSLLAKNWHDDEYYDHLIGAVALAQTHDDNFDLIKRNLLQRSAQRKRVENFRAQNPQWVDAPEEWILEAVNG